jgi:hypothetical protein
MLQCRVLRIFAPSGSDFFRRRYAVIQKNPWGFHRGKALINFSGAPKDQESYKEVKAETNNALDNRPTEICVKDYRAAMLFFLR